ncbi:MAG: 16S rRNA (guanine(966)-N(2))-methyltransferase RsmD [Gammaproteobacteria bacterium]|nr:16S rRNA (guanine(966)-N(2))-methyltransferase RsmD [Gammaproteobacteria bacterium]
MNKRVKANTIRIISGQWKGRKVEVLDVEGLRPTTDRTRETLFNWLMFDVQDARCLDLFAGSGVLGLECLSRGAKFVKFVELNLNSAMLLKQTLKHLKAGADIAEVTQQSFEAALLTPVSEPYDLVFLDPPFKSDYLVAAIKLLSQPGWLAEGAKVYIEQSSVSKEVEVPKGWHEHRRKRAGQSLSLLYRLESSD